MNEIDLHGLSHDEAVMEAEDFVLEESLNVGFSCAIITGNSPTLQEKIFRMLDRYELKYFVPSNNLGEIIVKG